MTVKIRQVMRVTGKGKPGPPPVIPTMAFVQQPTDTELYQPFNPEVSVQISDGQPDVLVLQMNTGDCHINFAYATADATGLATFTGLTAGTNPSGPSGCTVRVSNITRPQVADIVSDVFYVIPPEPWKLINWSFNTNGFNFYTGNLVQLNSIGGNLIVIQTYGLRRNIAGNPSISDNLNNIYIPQTTFTANTSLNVSLQCFICINPVVSANHIINIHSPNEQTLTNLILHVMVFAASKNPQLIIEGASYGNSKRWDDPLPNEISVQTPPYIASENTLCLSAFVSSGYMRYTTGPAAYDWQGADGYGGYEEYLAIASGFRVKPDTGIENPIWTVSAGTPDDFVNSLAMNLLVFDQS